MSTPLTNSSFISFPSGTSTWNSTSVPAIIAAGLRFVLTKLISAGNTPVKSTVL